MEIKQNKLILEPGNLYAVLKSIMLPEERGSELKENEVYMFLTSCEVFSCFSKTPLPYLEYHFLHKNKTIKARITTSSLSEYLMKI